MIISSCTYVAAHTILSFFFFLWLCHTACRGLVPQPRVKPVPHAVAPSSPNHWTAGEFLSFRSSSWAFLVAQLVENPPAMQETWFWEDPLEKGKATHSSILAWRIPWTLQSMGVTKSWTRPSNSQFHRAQDVPSYVCAASSLHIPLLASAAVVPVSSLL